MSKDEPAGEMVFKNSHHRRMFYDRLNSGKGPMSKVEQDEMRQRAIEAGKADRRHYNRRRGRSDA